MKAKPAGATFDDVEMRELSRGKPDRPWRRALTPAEDPSRQLEGVEDVRKNISPGGLEQHRHRALPIAQEDRTYLWATRAWIARPSQDYNVCQERSSENLPDSAHILSRRNEARAVRVIGGAD